MAYYINFQEFVPYEEKDNRVCIWCGQQLPFNKAHIISRKLVRSNTHEHNVLRHSVCKVCNDRFSKLETWILRSTPLSFARFHIYTEPNRKSDTKYPQYYYNDSINEYVYYGLAGEDIQADEDKWAILQVSQLLKDGDGFRHMTPLSPIDPVIQARQIIDSIILGEFRKWIVPDLPEDFSPRAVVEDGRIRVLGRTDEECIEFITHINTHELTSTERSVRVDGTITQSKQHFEWNELKWGQLGAKVAFEFLCLFKGVKYCLQDSFNGVLNTVNSDYDVFTKSLIFDEDGPVSDDDVPTPTKMDCSHDREFSFVSSVPIMHLQPGDHFVSIYDMDGWVYACVSVAGFPPAILRLGKPLLHLDDYFIVKYDHQEDHFQYLRLPYTDTKPLIPLEINRNFAVETLRQNYHVQII